MLAPGSRPLPEYQLVRPLGRGGFGEVWQASGPGGFDVALKFVRLGDEAGAVETQALEVMKGIRHAHLLVLFGACQVGDLLIVAMELGERTLFDCWRELSHQGLPGIPSDELIGYLWEAAAGLDFLNEARHPGADGGLVGVQHKDVKPQNLLLVGGSVKVADFGLARVLEHTVTRDNGGMTPAYAAPELLRGQATRWSDQYSLAVTYCQLRGGRLPFEGGPYEVMAGHLSREPDLSMLPQAERPPVRRALDKEPSRRWPNCRAFVEAVMAVGGPFPEPVPVSPAAAVRPPGRSPGPWAAVAVALLVLALPGAFLWRGLLGPRPDRAAPGDGPAAPSAGNQPAPSSAEPPTRAAAGGAAAARDALASWAAETRVKAAAGGAAAAARAALPAAGLRLGPVPAVSVEAGENGFLEVLVQRRRCAGPVAVEVFGLPDGVRVEPATLAAARETVRLRVHADDRTEPVSGTARVAARLGSLSAEAPVEVAVRVTPALRLPPLGDVTLEAGSGRTVEVRLERRNCKGPVELRLTDLPPGVRAEPCVLAPGESAGRLRLTAAADAAAAAVAVRLTAVAGDVRQERAFRLLVRDGAAALRRAVAELKERGRTLLEQKDYEQAIEAYTEVLRLAPLDAAAYAARAEARNQTKDYDRATADCNDALRLDPTLARAYAQRGYASCCRIDVDRTIADCTEAVRLDPNLALAYACRGYAYSQKKDHERALADAEHVVRLTPQSSRAYSLRGFVRARSGDVDRALADCERAIALDPKSASAYSDRGTVYSARKEYDRAVADYTEAIRLDPRYTHAYTNRGNAYHRLKQDDKAVEDYTRAIGIDPRFALAYSNRAAVCNSRGEYDRAVEDCTEAIRLNAKLALAYYNRGFAYARKKNVDNALADFTEAIRLDDHLAPAYADRSRVYRARGDGDRADADWRKAVELDPSLKK